MPLKLGTTNIGAIYKGTTPISAIYKGTTLVYSSFSWQEYLYEYLYHNLVPTTINSKNVQYKAKLVEIQGNSEVVNQLVDKSLYNAQASNVSYDTSTGKVELDLSTFVRYDNNIFNSYVFNIVQGHTYLLKGFKTTSTSASDASWWVQIRTSASGSSGRLYNQNEIFTALNSGLASVFIYVYANFTANDKIVGYPQLIDLTQEFPFDTPTTLTDPRVKRIIEQGYIPFNSGEIKDSVVGEISSQGYNLFDKDDTVYYNNTYLGSDNSFVGSQNYDSTISYIEVEPNQTYNLENANPNQGSNPAICFYDINKDFISGTKYMGSNNLSFTTPANAFYCRFSIGKTATNVSLHRTGTRTGYADYIPQQYLPTEYQEVEYLESSGTQYIDTGCVPNANTKLECVFQYTNTSGTQLNGSGWLNNQRINYGMSSGYSYFRIAYGNWYETSTTLDTNKHKVIIDGKNQVGYFDNETISFTYSYTSENTNIGLMARIRDGNIDFYCKEKLYSCKIYDNGTLVRNFIPCYRKSDNVAGLYDLVNRLFYTNNGTGTFTIGKKVNNNTIIHLPAPIDLGGVNTAHNTFAITKTNYVFTRNVFDVDLGTLNWTYESLGSGDNYYSDVISNAVQYSEVLCDKYNCDMSVSPSTLRNNAWISQTGRINITADGYSGNATTFKTAMSGVMLKYQLATPQVINIPRKHLGVKLIRDCTWSYQSGNLRFYTNDLNNVIKIPQTSETPNIYCEATLTKSFSTGSNLSMFVYTNGSLFIKDLSIDNTTDFINKYGNYYIFYETENEVQDFLDEMLIQSGGTITTDSEVLPNVVLNYKCK